MIERTPPAPPADLGHLPVWITPALIADTLRVWQPYYRQKLTERDALDILLAVGNLFDAIGKGT